MYEKMVLSCFFSMLQFDEASVLAERMKQGNRTRKVEYRERESNGKGGMKLRARKKGCERLNGRNRFDLNSLCFHSFVLSLDFFHCFLFSVSIPDQRVESKKKGEQVIDQM